MVISVTNFSSSPGLLKGKEGKRQYSSILTFRCFIMMTQRNKMSLLRKMIFNENSHLNMAGRGPNNEKSFHFCLLGSGDLSQFHEVYFGLTPGQ